MLNLAIAAAASPRLHVPQCSSAVLRKSLRPHAIKQTSSCGARYVVAHSAAPLHRAHLAPAGPPADLSKTPRSASLQAESPAFERLIEARRAYRDSLLRTFEKTSILQTLIRFGYALCSAEKEHLTDEEYDKWSPAKESWPEYAWRIILERVPEFKACVKQCLGKRSLSKVPSMMDSICCKVADAGGQFFGDDETTAAITLRSDILTEDEVELCICVLSHATEPSQYRITDREV